MRAILCLLATIVFPLLTSAEENGKLLAPSYSAASIVNSASNLLGPVAPNTLVTIYGENLAYTTKAISADDIKSGHLPTKLPGTGVQVLLGGIPAGLYYVSPTQINLQIPSNMIPEKLKLRLTLDGVAGPMVNITLTETAPALFQLNSNTVIATKADWSLITEENPGHPGDVIVLFATGLGQTEPNPQYAEIPMSAALIRQFSELRILFNGEVVEGTTVYYAGIAPGFAGLYQVNMRLPDSVPPNPEIRILVGDHISPTGIYLPVER